MILYIGDDIEIQNRGGMTVFGTVKDIWDDGENKTIFFQADGANSSIKIDPNQIVRLVRGARIRDRKCLDGVPFFQL